MDAAFEALATPAGLVATSWEKKNRTGPRQRNSGGKPFQVLPATHFDTGVLGVFLRLGRHGDLVKGPGL